MNDTTRFMMGIYQVSLMIRDTLEYVQGRPEHDVNFYTQRRDQIRHGLEEHSPLSSFCERNGEAGAKIRENIENFFNFAYGDEAEYITIENGKLIVDHARDLQALDYIIGLRETLIDIIKQFIIKAREDGVLEDSFANLIDLDEKFYRVLSSTIIFDKTHGLFLEFNKAMRDNGGKPSPQSNFVINDMKTLVGYCKFVSDHADKADTEFADLFAKHFTCLEYMEGSKQLPDNNGLKGEIDAVHDGYVKALQARELPWRMAYANLWNELVGYEQGLRQARSNQGTAAESDEKMMAKAAKKGN